MDVSGNASSSELKPEDVYSDGKLVLGSPSLTSGIPGDGVLTIEQARRWLSDPAVHQPIDFALPLGLRDAANLVWIPADNPLTRAKIELGRQLFFDGRLSGFGTMACAGCHIPERGYSAGMVMPDVGRNPSGCFNRLFSERQFWDGRAPSLEGQPESPIKHHFEMGTTPEECVVRLKSIAGYDLQFQVIFGTLDFESVGKALACFQRVLVTGASPWDYRRILTSLGDHDNASFSARERLLLEQLHAGARAHPMTESAIRGESLFFSDRTRCAWCHSGPNLTDEEYHNVGVGMDNARQDLGRFEITQRNEDRGAFKTPTLRNIAQTPPYMHDGRFQTLREVVDWFDRGGFVHADLDRAIRPINLTSNEKRDLVAFLEALTGPLPPVETARLPE
jgi:cytochrome c peroxidase